MARIKGNTTPILSFKNGAATLKDLGAYLVSIEFGDGEGDALTMADFAAGVRPVAMTVTFAQDFAVDSAYDYLWSNAGATGVTWHFKASDASTSQTNPDFNGTCTLPAKPYFSVEAGNEEQTFEVEIQLDSYNKAIV